MRHVLKDLQPQNVFQYFEEISSIPRGSGNEKAISDYMVTFATKLGLEVYQDSAYNVYIRKPATVGYEQVPGVILQGHLDMVCEKNKDVDHDFLTDALELYIDEDWIRAKGTTLGADNGVAIAYQMAILADNTLQHPTLECLMTTDEERGMTGVANLHPEHITGKILLNLDTEVEGEFLVSCAGGAKTFMSFPYTTVSLIPDAKLYKLTINGLKGGHSGADIHHERANAHLLMGRLLNKLIKQIPMQLISLDGGTKDNVITRECEVQIAIPENQASLLDNICTQMLSIFNQEYAVQDPNIKLHISLVESADSALDPADAKKLIQLLLSIPNGVMGYDPHMDKLVQTSLNLGIVEITSNHIRLGTAVRSSVASKKQELLDQLEALASGFNVKFEVLGDYPAWQYDDHSRIRELAISLYQTMYDVTPSVTAIHAGLECGFISEKCPGLDMISMGPNLQHIHSPEEAVSISSMGRVYEYVVKLLEALINY